MCPRHAGLTVHELSVDVPAVLPCDAVLAKARRLLGVRSLRATDALQLAAALL
jgi:hypothetical protein